LSVGHVGLRHSARPLDARIAITTASQRRGSHRTDWLGIAQAEPGA